MNLTIETVKSELPKVQVKTMSGKIVEGSVTGRRNKFATVYISSEVSHEFSWQTIANALNNNRPLLAL